MQLLRFNCSVFSVLSCGKTCR